MISKNDFQESKKWIVVRQVSLIIWNVLFNQIKQLSV